MPAQTWFWQELSISVRHAVSGETLTVVQPAGLDTKGVAFLGDFLVPNME